MHLRYLLTGYSLQDKAFVTWGQEAGATLPRRVSLMRCLLGQRVLRQTWTRQIHISICLWLPAHFWCVCSTTGHNSKLLDYQSFWGWTPMKHYFWHSKTVVKFSTMGYLVIVCFFNVQVSEDLWKVCAGDHRQKGPLSHLPTSQAEQGHWTETHDIGLIINSKPLSEVSEDNGTVLLELEMAGHVFSETEHRCHRLAGKWLMTRSVTDWQENDW